MGSMPRLKIKDEIRYRKGSTNESCNCKACKHYRKEWIQFVRPHGPDVKESRCIIIGGMNSESIRYRVRDDYTCDRQEMSKEYSDYMDKLSGRPT